MHRGVESVISYITEFLAPLRSDLSLDAREVDPGGVPHWITQLAKLYEVGTGEEKVILIYPLDDLSVDQGARIYSVVRESIGRPTLLIADRLPSKGRGTLVRLHIPHVVKGHSIYSPELGVKYRSIAKPDPQPKQFRPTLSVTAVKIATHYLLNPKNENEVHTLSEWQSQLKKTYSDAPSLSTCSRAFSELMQSELVEVSTLGTAKQIRFYDRKQVWERLVTACPILIERKYKTSNLPKDEPLVHLFLLAGETALAKMSDLNEPINKTIAIDSWHWRMWEKSGKNPPQAPALDTQAVHVEVWELGALSYPRNERYSDCVNPIMLALSLRGSMDPRIQSAIQEMLEPLELDASHLWGLK